MSTRWGTHRKAAPPAVRHAVLTRDGHQCTALDNGQRCTQTATEVHHVIEDSRGGEATPDNLVSLCAWHHRKLTAAHAHSIRHRITTKRPAEPHPGLRST